MITNVSPRNPNFARGRSRGISRTKAFSRERSWPVGRAVALRSSHYCLVLKMIRVKVQSNSKLAPPRPLSSDEACVSSSDTIDLHQ